MANPFKLIEEGENPFRAIESGSTGDQSSNPFKAIEDNPFKAIEQSSEPSLGWKIAEEVPRILFPLVGGAAALGTGGLAAPLTLAAGGALGEFASQTIHRMGQGQAGAKPDDYAFAPMAGQAALNALAGPAAKLTSLAKELPALAKYGPRVAGALSGAAEGAGFGLAGSEVEALTRRGELATPGELAMGTGVGTLLGGGFGLAGSKAKPKTPTTLDEIVANNEAKEIKQPLRQATNYDEAQKHIDDLEDALGVGVSSDRSQVPITIRQHANVFRNDKLTGPPDEWISNPDYTGSIDQQNKDRLAALYNLRDSIGETEDAAKRSTLSQQIGDVGLPPESLDRVLKEVVTDAGYFYGHSPELKGKQTNAESFQALYDAVKKELHPETSDVDSVYFSNTPEGGVKLEQQVGAKPDPRVLGITEKIAQGLTKEPEIPPVGAGVEPPPIPPVEGVLERDPDLSVEEMNLLRRLEDGTATPEEYKAHQREMDAARLERAKDDDYRAAISEEMAGGPNTQEGGVSFADIGNPDRPFANRERGVPGVGDIEILPDGTYQVKPSFGAVSRLGETNPKFPKIRSEEIVVDPVSTMGSGSGSAPPPNTSTLGGGRVVPTENPPTVKPGFTRFYRADEKDAQGPLGRGWSTDLDYVSSKYGAGEMGSESIWYKDIPSQPFLDDMGHVPSVVDESTFKAYGVDAEPGLFRRTEPHTDPVRGVGSAQPHPLESNISMAAAEVAATAGTQQNLAQVVSGNIAEDIQANPRPYEYVPLAEQGGPEGKVFYHGTKADIGKLSDVDVYGTSKVGNLYGEGLYLTDDPNIAASYAKRKGKGPTGSVLAAKLGNLSLIDLEKPLPDDVLKVYTDLWFSPEEIETLRGKTGKEVFQELKEVWGQEDKLASEVQEIYSGINSELSGLGYDGLIHQGGAKTKGKPHNVAILFEDDVVDRSGAQVGRLLKNKFTDEEIPFAPPPPSPPPEPPVPPADAPIPASPGKPSPLEQNISMAAAMQFRREITDEMGRVAPEATVLSANWIDNAFKEVEGIHGALEVGEKLHETASFRAGERSIMQLTEALMTGKLSAPAAEAGLSLLRRQVSDIQRAMSLSGSTLGAGGRLMQRVGGALEELGVVAAKTPWEKAKQFLVHDIFQIRRAGLVSQLGTALGNTVSQYPRAWQEVGMDAMRGFLGDEEARLRAKFGIQALVRPFKNAREAKADLRLLSTSEIPQLEARVERLLRNRINEVPTGGFLDKAQAGFKSKFKFLDKNQNMSVRDRIIDSMGVYNLFLNDTLDDGMRSLAWRASMKGALGEEGYQAFISNPKAAWKNGREVITSAFDAAITGAHEQSFSENPEHVFRWLQDTVNKAPVLSLLTPFPRFMGSAFNYVMRHNPTGMLRAFNPTNAQDPAALKKIYSQAVFGTAMLSAAVAARQAVKSDKDLGPFEIRTGAAKDALDMKKYYPMTFFLAMDDMIQTMEGGTPFWNIPYDELRETFLAFGRPSVAVPAAIEAMLGKGDVKGLGDLLKVMAGDFIGGFNVGMKTPKELLEGVTPGLEPSIDRSSTTKGKLLGPFAANVPFASKFMDFPPVINPTTGKDILDVPPVKLFGLNIPAGIIRQLSGATFKQRNEAEKLLREFKIDPFSIVGKKPTSRDHAVPGLAEATTKERNMVRNYMGPILLQQLAPKIDLIRSINKSGREAEAKAILRGIIKRSKAIADRQVAIQLKSEDSDIPYMIMGSRAGGDLRDEARRNAARKYLVTKFGRTPIEAGLDETNQ